MASIRNPAARMDLPPDPPPADSRASGYGASAVALREGEVGSHKQFQWANHSIQAAGATGERMEAVMRQVRYSVAMSLDGYIAGPNGEADWIVMDPTIDFAT